MFGLVQFVPLPLFEPPLAGVDIQFEVVSSVSKVVLSIPPTIRLMILVAVRMLADGMG
ncbi:hypothetical protein H6G74_02520 [Nostoc spongiaeforme FACHB-130]|uniref:Uncharacterized protein n=1 Tax=Nostoc spongiaeforme FACHB-130 TaxID=1357510 RepID=A0ABR8FSJ5_9NOSO|nr:hypothetical protein [Nostoc spongiaeforme]MBD2593202.1 hypothetical protein [Nostoc spongiaeforme FACHB-130]